MFKRFLLLVVTIPTLLGFTNTIVSCKLDLEPEVLIVTSYENAHQQSSEDKIIFQKLQEIYGEKVVTAIFSYEDANKYADIFISLITKFNLKKVFILDPSFINYLPKTSDEAEPNNALVRVLQQYTNVDFYFFNNQISDTVKQTNNIYEFRFDVGNKATPTPALTYGAAAAKHFYEQITDDSGAIDTNKYNFDVNRAGQWVVRVGMLNNIGSAYQEKVIEDFKTNLASNVPNNTIYEYYSLDLDITNVYSFKNSQLVKEGATFLYNSDYVNFIFNSNYWYNNAIVQAASSATQTKTTAFIANSVTDKDDYKYKGVNYMVFAYNLDLSILEHTTNNKFPTDFEVVDDAPEKEHAYGLNSNLNFVDGD